MSSSGPARTQRPSSASGVQEGPAPSTSDHRVEDTGDSRLTTPLLAAVPHILSAHTSVINGLALRLIALEARAESLATEAKRTAPAKEWRGALPAVHPSTIFSAAPPTRLLAPEAIDGNTSLLELCLLLCLLKRTRAETVFEFGTFDGRTTVNLAANSAPGGRVLTLDLPREQAASTEFPLAQGDAAYVDKDVSGARYRGTPFEPQITQLYGDSATFDFSPYAATVDFVFIDASHAYEYVINDSRAALGLLRGGQGVIAWHDYTSWWGGVVRALDELFTKEPKFAGLRHIEGTALAYTAMA